MRKSEYLDELHPEFYGFKKQNYDKKIFLNGVINKKYANIKEILKFLKRHIVETLAMSLCMFQTQLRENGLETE